MAIALFWTAQTIESRVQISFGQHMFMLCIHVVLQAPSYGVSPNMW